MLYRCFVIEPTERVRRALRRYSRADEGCPDNGGHHHNAEVAIEDGPAIWAEDGRSYRTAPASWPGDDPRWPAACSCGYAFAEDDHWQLWYELIYRAPSGAEYTLRDAPIGAMWRLPWWEETPAWVGPDGQCWAVMLPPGGVSDVWIIDGPSSSGGRWERTGTPPAVTARPSILTPRYHGFLTEGVLSEHLG